MHDTTAELPSAVDLFMETISDFQQDIPGYLKASVGIMLYTMAIFAVTLVAVVLGAIPGLVMEDPLILQLGVMGAALLVVVLLFPLGVWVRNSVATNLWRRVTTGESLGFGAVFQGGGARLGAVVLLQLLVGAMVFFGAMMCYLPGILLAMALAFAHPAVVAHGHSPIEAIRLSLRHTQQHFVWHLTHFFIGFAATLVLSYVPLLGMALAILFQHAYTMRAYKAAFGVNGGVEEG